jgi:hypothetical protein
MLGEGTATYAYNARKMMSIVHKYLVWAYRDIQWYSHYNENTGCVVIEFAFNKRAGIVGHRSNDEVQKIVAEAWFQAELAFQQDTCLSVREDT